VKLASEAHNNPAFVEASSKVVKSNAHHRPIGQRR
jgi:hypothetical protein